MEFSRPEYWSGLPIPSPVDLPDSGIEPGSPALRADSLPTEPPGKLSSLKKKKDGGLSIQIKWHCSADVSELYSSVPRDYSIL